MALQLFDRVQVAATANTTVSFTLGTAVTGYQDFSVMTNGNTTYYGSSDGTNWEVGIGTYSSTGPTLTRTTILSSSNAGLAVTFTSAPTVWIDYPSIKAVYQDASGNVGIGTTAPTTKLTLSSNTVLPSAGAITGTNLWQVGADTTNNLFSLDSFGAPNQLTTRRSNGTSASPTAVASGNNLLLINSFGYGATGYSSAARISMNFQASETWTDTAQGTQILISTTTNGTTTTTERMRIDNAGNVGIGTTSPTAKFEVLSTSGIYSRNSTNSSTSYLGTVATDYWSTPSYTGTLLGQSGSTATGTTLGLSNANLGQLIFQNGSAGLIYTNGSSPIVFGTNSTERMRISASGGVYVGSAGTDPGATNLQVAGAIVSTRITPRVLASTANSATPTLNTDSYDMMVITGQSVAITSFTTNLTGTPTNGQRLWISITGTGAIAITWGASFEASTVPLPTTTVTTARLDVGFVWNVATSKWRCVASA